jgi:hypothetical protein
LGEKGLLGHGIELWTSTSCLRCREAMEGNDGVRRVRLRGEFKVLSDFGKIRGRRRRVHYSSDSDPQLEDPASSVQHDVGNRGRMIRTTNSDSADPNFVGEERSSTCRVRRCVLYKYILYW